PLLDRVFARVAPAAERLHRGPGAPHRRLGREELGYRGLEGCRLARVELAGGAPDKEARGVYARRHVGEPERDRLMLGDRLSELLARLGVLDGVLERRAREAGG